MVLQAFQLQTRIIFGIDALSALGSEAQSFGQTVCLVSGKRALTENGILQKVTERLNEAGFKVELFTEVEPEPSLETVSRGLVFARECKAEWVLGLGGGSAMDTAKAIAGLYHTSQTVSDYFEGLIVEKTGIPLVTLPTTSGSGAEVTLNAVLTKGRIKKSIRDLRFAARLTIVDPKLTVNLPPEITAYSGMDALVQAIEAYTSKGANSLTDIYAFAAIERIGANLLRAYQNGDDLEARSEMALGSLMAGIALSNARLGAVHGLAHAVGIATGKPHGLVCAMLLVPVMRFNLSICFEKYAKIATSLGMYHPTGDPLDLAAGTIKTIMNLERKLGITHHLSDFELSESDYAWIIEDSLTSGSLKANPREVTAQDLLNILHERF